MFSRNARLFTLGTFLLSLAFTLFQLMRNLYLKEAGFSELFIGESLSLFSFGSLVGSIPAAILLSRRRTKPMLLVSTLGAGAGYFGIATLLTEWGILGASLAAGWMMSVYQVAAAPFLMEHSSPEERTHLFSSIFAVRTGSGMIGSLGGGWLFRIIASATGDVVLGYRWTLLFGVLFALVALVPFALIREAHPVQRENPFALRFLRARRGLYTRIVLPFFALGLGAGLIIPFLNLYFRNRFGQRGDTIGLFFAMMQLCMTLGIMAGPILARRWGLVRTIVYTELGSIPFMLVLAFTFRLEWAVAAFLLRGMLMNMAQPLATHFAMEIVTAEERPLVNSLVTMSWMGSWMISTAFGGALIDRFGFTLPFLITVGLYVVSAALYFAFFGHVERAGQVRLPIPLTDLKG
jgi:MFS family permease